MHMADALLSPAVGGIMWAASAGAIAYSSRKVRQQLDDRKAPLMGVLGAFIFAAQMINFTIPGTGSSGHLGGGLLLAVLLGPHAAFLTIASVLVIQALFFADGGLLALGCNIFNMGFFPAFIAYPFIYTSLVNGKSGRGAVTFAAILTAVVGLQLGALAVVLETVFSGISELPFTTFALLMQPIHLAIGVIEGVVTAAVVSFIVKARPEILESGPEAGTAGRYALRNAAIGFFCAAIITGGVISRFASENPDGLEWSIARITGCEELHSPERGVHAALAAVQSKMAFLPDYSFKKNGESKTDAARETAGSKAGTSVSGVVGGVVTFVLALLIGLVLKRRGEKG
ncbi:MAG: cobalt/nickel transport system permease [Geobacteraceae bacterium]|nr:MAG: cobalt/nickel transport system permease [Geobacteraceae bacterium]